MNWKVLVAQNRLGLFPEKPVYVDAPDIVTAIEAAEKHIIVETAADPKQIFTVSAELADAQKIIKAEDVK